MGDKPVRSKGKKGYDRMEDFLEFCFQPELQKTTIIAVGHSMYFKKFFNCFLDHDLDPKHYASDAKQYKLKNAAAVRAPAAKPLVELLQLTRTFVLRLG